MLALLKLPEVNTPTQGVFNNLHGYWQPPTFVMEFWATGAAFHFIDDADYHDKSEKILSSYLNAIKLYYRDHAL